MRILTSALALLVGASGAHALEFADDFNSDAVNPKFRVKFEDIANEDTALSLTNGVIMLDIQDPIPEDEQEADIKLRFDLADSYSIEIKTPDELPTAGRQHFYLNGSFFNQTSNGGPGATDDSISQRTDDVDVEVAISLSSEADQSYLSYCFKTRDTEGNTQPFSPTGQKCFNFQTQAESGTEYTVTIGLDRANNELYASINDERYAEPVTTEIFDAGDPFPEAVFRLQDGASNGIFSVSALSFDDQSVDLSIASKSGQYKTDDFDNYRDEANRSKEVVNGQLILSASNDDIENSINADLRMAEFTGYLEADITYSSESAIVTDEAGAFAGVRVSGGLYNDGASSGDGDSTGNVWGSVMLIQNNDVDGLVGEYCLLRADNADWTESSDLADMTDDMRCPTFDLTVQADTAYNAVLQLDAEAKTVSFTLGGETKVINIDTDVVINPDNLLRIQSRMARGATGTVVGIADNVRNDPAALSDEEKLAMTGGGDGVGSDGGSGSGCSIASAGSFDPLLPILSILSLIFMGMRRRLS
ncbi:JDVT-CTERM domain-containing protein [Granulosicoccus sp.]|nr:JDVT-CTERM domain-containing protein [Granulosicoccus sp.]MDB4223239.1 JDVT-CTERM domain-containing protein [Granulosicoccus sp.]